MATKKATEQDKKETIPAWDGRSGHEVRCHKCSGMVNHNGCAEKDCPVSRNNDAASQRHN